MEAATKWDINQTVFIFTMPGFLNNKVVND